MPAPDLPRYELLPFASAREEVDRLPVPVRLTVTASPRLALEDSFALSVDLRRRGHGVTPHLAARMLHSREQLDALLELSAQAGIDDLFVIGGDAPEPAGPYASTAALLEVLASHPQRPAALGVGAYPEGHPFIAEDALMRGLLANAAHADYVVTQLCFAPEALIAWLTRAREAGLALPVLAGVPGPVDRRRLLEVSLRVGVGPSVSFLRKQRGLRRLLRSPVHAAERLLDGLAGELDDGPLGLAGLHYYTFNELVRTWRWHEDRARPAAPRRTRPSWPVPMRQARR